MSTPSITVLPPSVPTQAAEPTGSGATPAAVNAPALTQRAQTPSPLDTPSGSAITLTTDIPHAATTTTVITEPVASTRATTTTTASAVGFSDLALDVKHEIFRIGLRAGVFNSGVLSYAKTAKLPRAEVIEFLVMKSVDEEFGSKLRASTLKGMVESSKQMVANAPELRKSFDSSARYTAVHANVPGFPKRTFDEFAGVEFRFAEINPGSNLLPDLRAIEGKPIKLNADKIGRQRFIDEVLPALAQVPKGCPVVLSAVNNRLGEQDLAALVKVLENNPCVVQLNLDRNPLCKSDSPCLPLADLFKLPGPITHLYLADTGFNDATAACVHETMANHACLKRVDLRSNELTEDGAVLLAEAVARKKPNGEIHVNPVLEAVRLQHNRYGDYNFKMAKAVQVIEIVKRIYLNKEHDPVEIPMVAEIDGTGFGYRDFRSMNDLVQHGFDNAAVREKL